MSEYCEKCGLMLVTPEAQAVLDAVVRKLGLGCTMTSWMGRELIEAGEKYRASARPAPRYTIGRIGAKYCVFDRHRIKDNVALMIAECDSQADAEKIAAALNAAEEK